MRKKRMNIYKSKEIHQIGLMKNIKLKRIKKQKNRIFKFKLLRFPQLTNFFKHKNLIKKLIQKYTRHYSIVQFTKVLL